METKHPEYRVETDTPIAVNTKRVRGPARCTNFDKFKKIEPIPLLIKDGNTKVSCANANLFARRVTWIIKHHADTSYNRWNDVPDNEEEELCNRVRVRISGYLLIVYMYIDTG